MIAAMSRQPAAGHFDFEGEAWQRVGREEVAGGVDFLTTSPG
jgi:hypothetical protein